MVSTNASRTRAPAVDGWEIAIKAALGTLDNVPEDLKGFIGEQLWENAFTVLPIRPDPVLDVHTLPLHHRDPFDRLLLVQALAEDIPLLSRGPQFAPYSVNVIW
jgi:PIN domain nuclease of toxin-antitoxin system